VAEKTEFLQKIRVEPHRLRRYRRALAKVQHKVGPYKFQPTMSEWVLRALDREADILLGPEG
jgi:hypothetical protein